MNNAARLFKTTSFLTGTAGFLLAGSDGPYFPYINIAGALMLAGSMILVKEIKP